MMRGLLSVLSLSLGLTASQALAQEAVPTDDIASGLSQKTMSGIARNPDAFLERALRRFFDVAEDGRLSRGQLDTHVALFEAKRRARALEDILRFDLDGDLAIDAQEVAQVVGFGSADAARWISLYRAEVDRDGDGALSRDEMAAHAVNTVEPGAPNQDLLEDLKTFDLNGDGAVTADEIAEAVQRIGTRAEVRQVEEPVAACKVPEPSAQAEVVFITAHEGSAISQVTVAGRSAMTTVVHVVIEEGDAPVYIVAEGLSPIVWDVTGATGRVEEFVSGIRGFGTGVVGLEAGQVVLRVKTSCLPGYVAPMKGAAVARDVPPLEERVGRPVTEVAGIVKMGTVFVPSGAHRRPDMAEDAGDYQRPGGARTLGGPDGPQPLRGRPVNPTSRMMAQVYWDLNRLYPGGIFDVAPEDILATGAVKTYDILPSGAGLLALLEAYDLVVTEENEVLIRRRIPRFPAGLIGPFGVTFLLPRGVPMPLGDLRNAVVLDAVTRECVGGRLCRKRR